MFIPTRPRHYFAVSLSTVVACTLTGATLADERFDPIGLLLTWQQDPTTTMTIDFQTKPAVDGERPSLVQYKALESDEDWEQVEGSSHPFPHTERMIHRVELTDLKPATTYAFRFGDDSKAYRFQTMPEDVHEPLRFINGGDLQYGDRFRPVNRVAMQYDPDFIVWGGDLPYANGDPRRVDRWRGWFTDIKETLIAEDGRVVPIVVAIGNHELFGERRLEREGMSSEEAEAFMQEHGLEDDHVTFFFDLFAFPGKPTYGVLDFGDYMSLVILDTGHHTPIRGEQTQWLAEVLHERDDRPHVFPVYHVPAYPSARSYTAGRSTRVREYWVPLFQQHGVRVAFEHHDHTYKRTYPMLDERIHANGIVFLGDGAWGVDVRERRDSEHQDYYLKRFEAQRHCIVVTVHGPHQHYLVVNDEGDVIDEYPQTPRARE